MLTNQEKIMVNYAMNGLGQSRKAAKATAAQWTKQGWWIGVCYVRRMVYGTARLQLMNAGRVGGDTKLRGGRVIWVRFMVH